MRNILFSHEKSHRIKFHKHFKTFILSGEMVQLDRNLEDGGSRLFRNFDTVIPDYTASCFCASL